MVRHSIENHLSVDRVTVGEVRTGAAEEFRQPVSETTKAPAPAVNGMCYFLTVGVEFKGIEALVQAVPRGMALGRVNNPHVTRHMGTTNCTFVLTSGMCACDLYYGRGEEVEAVTTAWLSRREERAIRKYIKLGWSAAKIDRALEATASHAKKTPSFLGPRGDVRELLASVAEQIGNMAFLAHFYGGDIETARIELSPDTARLTPDEFRQPDRMIDEDQVVRVVARAIHGKNRGHLKINLA